MREAELDTLMDRLAGGDRSAFDPLYEALRPRAARLVAMRLRAELVPDVVQSALLQVFAHASDFCPGRPCLPWFYAIVANEIRGAARRHARDVPTELADDALVDPREPESALVARELHEALHEAIAALDDDAASAIRAVLGLHAPPAIARAAFRKRVSRAYARLRLMLRGHDAS